MNRDNLLNPYGLCLPTHVGQWARRPRPYDWTHTSHKCQHALLIDFTIVCRLRTCFKEQEIALKHCGFVNPQRAALGDRGWVSQTVGFGNQAPTIDLTGFSEYSSPSELRKKPSFEEKTRFQDKPPLPQMTFQTGSYALQMGP